MATLRGRLWHNWSSSVQCTPQHIAQPASIEELIQLIKACSNDNRHVRVVGSGHSFTPLVQTDEVLLSLERMQGIEEIDTEHGMVTVLAGTPLKTLGEILYAHGLAQENLGGIDTQTIAGAISTGTHGTGLHTGNLSTQVAGLTLVTANGELLECSDEHSSDLFKAAQISLGTLGVIVKVKLRVVPAKRLHFKSHREPFSYCLTNFERYNQENSHFEIFWFPHTSWVQVKFLNETKLPISKRSFWGDFNKVVLENGIYWLLSECCRLLPPLSRSISALSTRAILPVDEVNYSHRAYVAPRMVRVQAMEYALPIEHAQEALREIQACIHQHRFQVHIPLGCRFVRADDIWLSPAYQRDSVYIAAHMYRGMEYESYFRHMEEILQRYNGRPHWGKMHTQDATRLAALYPRWHDFRRIRAVLDPQGLFLNDYLRHLLNTEGPVSSSPAYLEREVAAQSELLADR
jgi:FAD-linked oxidoreductase